MIRHGRQLATALATAIATCAGLAAPGCGSSEEPEGRPLPRQSVAELQKRLDEIERRYRDGIDNGNAGACQDIQTDSIPAVDQIVAGLPNDVDPELRDAVDESFARLEELTREDCAEVEPPEPRPRPEPEPEPVPTVPEPTAPEPTVPEPTVPEPTVPEDFDEDESGNGEGKAKGKDKQKGQDGGAVAPPDGEGG